MSNKLMKWYKGIEVYGIKAYFITIHLSYLQNSPIPLYLYTVIPLFPYTFIPVYLYIPGSYATY